MEGKKAYNIIFTTYWPTWKQGALCFYSSSVLVDGVVLLNPLERQATKRYRSVFGDTQTIKMFIKKCHLEILKNRLSSIKYLAKNDYCIYKMTKCYRNPRTATTG